MARRPGLGKGLDALIPAGENPIVESGVRQISVGNIMTNPRQPRTQINPSDLEELAGSIREHGILQPLIVRLDSASDRYVLIAGERRWRAAQLAGLEKVPVIIREAGDQEQLELALIENVQRADLSALETAEAYRQLTEEFDMSQEDIAQRVGKSRVAISNTLRLLKLPDRVQTALAEGKITEGHARALLALSSSQAQIAAMETIIKHELNVRQTEELVRKLSGQRPARPPQPEPLPEIRELEERLRLRLGTRVQLNHSDKGGSIVIHYYSDEELNSLLDQILRE